MKKYSKPRHYWLRVMLLHQLFRQQRRSTFSILITTPFRQTQQGVFYSLPRTVVNIEVSIDRIENYKGPYAEYARNTSG